MQNNYKCRGTKTKSFPDNCGLPLYEPWPNSSRFFFNGAYWYPKVEQMSNLSQNNNNLFIIIFVILIVILLLKLNY